MYTTKDQLLAGPNRDTRPAKLVGAHLRELKLGDVEFLHNLVSEYVGGGEEPTSSAPLLVSPWTGLEIDDVVEHMLIHDLGISIQ